MLPFERNPTCQISGAPARNCCGGMITQSFSTQATTKLYLFLRHQVRKEEDMAFTFGRARDGKKTMAAGSPPAGACSASKTMSDVPSALFNMRSRPEVSQFVRSTAETTAERSAVGLLTLRAGAVRGAMRCQRARKRGKEALSTLILCGHKLRQPLYTLRHGCEFDARGCSGTGRVEKLGLGSWPVLLVSYS